MPVKSPSRPKHHATHKKEKRTKHFLKVYAPYIPLLTIVSCGIMLSHNSGAQNFPGQVKSYATNVSDDGLLEETNKRRASEGLRPLVANNLLDQAAQTKADDMQQKNYWSHTTPDGKEPWDFITRYNYAYRKAAENLAFGFDDNKATLNGWMNSPGHRANVMDPDLQEVGFGVANAPDYQGHGEETIIVAMYGTPVAAPVAAAQPTNTPPAVAPVTITAEPKKVSYIESLTNGKAPWAGFAAGLVIGSVFMYLAVAHLRGIRRAIRSSERFVIHHPLFDATLVALLVLMLIVTQTVGNIY